MDTILIALITYSTPSDKRERSDRGERVARYGDWSEHVSSSGKYLNGSKAIFVIG